MTLMHKDEMLAGCVPKSKSVSVTADGVKTYATLLSELWALADKSKIGRNSVLVHKGPTTTDVCNFVREESNNVYCFSNVVDDQATSTYIHFYKLKESSSERWLIQLSSSVTHLDRSAYGVASGTVIYLYYN